MNHIKKFILLLLFLSGYLFGQNIDKSLYREVPMMALAEYPQEENHYFKSVAHFRESFIGNIFYKTLRIKVHAGRDYYFLDVPTSLDIVVSGIKPFQIVTMYYHVIEVWSGAFERKLHHIELSDKYLIVDTRYVAMENLRLRTTSNLTGRIIKIIRADEWVTVLEEGDAEIIDGISSVWVKVRSDDNAEGWCFGGYLGFCWLKYP
jgi:hypothetical protein